MLVRLKTCHIRIDRKYLEDYLHIEPNITVQTFCHNYLIFEIFKILSFCLKLEVYHMALDYIRFVLINGIWQRKIEITAWPPISIIFACLVPFRAQNLWLRGNIKRPNQISCLHIFGKIKIQMESHWKISERDNVDICEANILLDRCYFLLTILDGNLTFLRKWNRKYPDSGCSWIVPILSHG